MGPTAWALVVALVLPVAGCAEGGDAETPAVSLRARTPAFSGELPLVLAAGNRAFLDPPCAAEPPGRVCSADGATTYLRGVSQYDVTLVRASMRPDEGHAAWVVRLRFEPQARVSAAAEAALDAGGLLLVLEGDEVITDHLVRTVPAPSVRDGRIDLEPLPKAEAAGLIRSLAPGVE